MIKEISEELPLGTKNIETAGENDSSNIVNVRLKERARQEGKTVAALLTEAAEESMEEAEASSLSPKTIEEADRSYLRTIAEEYLDEDERRAGQELTATTVSEAAKNTAEDRGDHYGSRE